MDKKNLGSNVRRYMKLTDDANTIGLLKTKSGVCAATISNILNGKSEATISILEKIADALGQSVEKLLAPKPQLSSLRFRTHVTMTAREKAAKETLLYTTAQWVQDYVEFSKKIDFQPEYNLEKISEKNPIKAAEQVRRIWKIKKDVPIPNLEDYVFKSGIKLLGFPFGFKQTFGLSIGKEDGGPMIFINTDSSITGERRLFTLAHELGHLLLHEDSYGTDVEIEPKEEENQANQFASHLLMPNDAFKELLTETKHLGMVESILKIKRYFNVSYETVLRRVCEDFNCDKEQMYKKFNLLYKQKYNHDLKNHYEPFSFGEYEFMNTCIRNEIFNSVEMGKTSVKEASNLLLVSQEKFNEIYDFWKTEKGNFKEMAIDIF